MATLTNSRSLTYNSSGMMHCKFAKTDGQRVQSSSIHAENRRLRQFKVSLLQKPGKLGLFSSCTFRIDSLS